MKTPPFCGIWLGVFRVTVAVGLVGVPDVRLGLFAAARDAMHARMGRAVTYGLASTAFQALGYRRMRM